MSKLRYSATLFKQFLQFAKAHKAYWIIPLILIMALMVVLITVGQFSAPFIYTLF